jgi:DivIVA domain-containing protein
MRRLEPEEVENQSFPIARRGYEPQKVDAFLRVVATYYRDAIRLADERPAVTQPSPAPPSPAPSAFDQVGEQVATILTTTQRAADELRRDAEREIQQMRRVAAAEAAETTQAATDQLATARQLKANAQRDAEALVAEARDQAEGLKQEAHKVAAKLEENARQRAARVEQKASGKLAAVTAEARRRYDVLYGASQQSVEQLRSVESVLEKARGDLAIEHLMVIVEDLSAVPPDGDEEVQGFPSAPDGAPIGDASSMARGYAGFAPDQPPAASPEAEAVGAAVPASDAAPVEQDAAPAGQAGTGSSQAPDVDALMEPSPAAPDNDSSEAADLRTDEILAEVLDPAPPRRRKPSAPRSRRGTATRGGAGKSGSGSDSVERS